MKERQNYRKSSLAPFGKNGEPSKNFLCWTASCPAVKADPTLMFAKCVVVGGSMDGVLKLKQVDPPCSETFDVAPGDVFNANVLVESANIEDIGYLPHTNIPCVLSLLKERYVQGFIYTTAVPLLVSINPFKDLKNTTDEWIDRYSQSTKPETLPPHLFKTARAALENLREYRKNQTLIVSGESGAGKTEATKQAMRYFASGCVDGNNTVQQKLLAGNPVLEAFGNAKTIRNNNSSRFGRFMMLELSSTRGIVHGKVSNFLLEKVRVVSQEKNERSYHIFYQLLKGANAEMRSKYHLRDMHEYAYLTQKSGGCFDVPGIDDEADFAEVMDSLLAIGLDSALIESTLSILSGLLLLGNVEIDATETEKQDATTISSASKKMLNEACDLIFIDVERLTHELLTKTTKVGAQVITGSRTKEEATLALMSLSKNLYDKLFDWLVKQLTKTIEWEGETPPFIGILDIFGFELLEVNSLEQLLINVTNEFLQKHFIDVVFESEVKLYEAEGVSTAELVWTDNQALVSSLCGKKDSIFALLEDSCLGIKSSDEGLCATLLQRLQRTGFIAEAPKDKRMKFVVRHTIADIEYTCADMLEKNKDSLKKEVMNVVNASSNPVTSQLFAGVVVEAGKIGRGTLIASSFLKNLETMLDVIRETEPHFIRCLKPNETKQAMGWDSSKVLNQLFSLSILEALQLRQVGYAYRRTYNDFCSHFKWLNIALCNSDQDRRSVAEELLKNSGLLPTDWTLGKTLVFLKPDAAKKLALFQRQRLAQFEPLVRVIEPAWRKILLRRALAKTVGQIVRVQSYVRMLLTENKIQVVLEKKKAILERRQRAQTHLRSALSGAKRNNAAAPSEMLCKQQQWRQAPSECVASSEDLELQDVRSLNTDLFLRSQKRRSEHETALRAHALARARARRPSGVNMEQTYHIWNSVKILFKDPLSERRLQNICTILRNNLDENFGHFWQVIMNRTEHFGVASTHIPGSMHIVEQRGTYRDGRSFLFHLILYKTLRPKKQEILLHEIEAEKTYEICRRWDFSRSVRVSHSKVPQYMVKDISYLLGMLAQRYQYTREWAGYAARIQSYLMGRYSEPFGGSWNVHVQEGPFFVSRLWTKHSRFIRVELDISPSNKGASDFKDCETKPVILTVVCFEACSP